MYIRILEFEEGAKRATGVTVIIDVFRAFSVSCYAFDAGALKLITVKDVDDAFRLKKRYKSAILAGERDERKIEGFDIGNSPTEILENDLDGKIVIQTTTAGTMGLSSAVNSEILLTGSLVNASAVASYIRMIDPEEVSLVAMGYRGTTRSEEDIICAELIADRLRGGSEDFRQRISDLKDSSGKRFFRIENLSFSPPTDFFLCTMTDRFDFVLKAERRDDGFIELYRIDQASE